MGDKNPKAKAKDLKKKADDKANVAKQVQATKDAKTASAAKPGKK